MAEERLFVAIKPDGVMRGLIGDITGKFEKRGFKLLALKLSIPPEELIRKHYAEHAGKPFFESFVAYMSKGPICAMVWQGKHAVTLGRAIIGATLPITAEPGSIRGTFAFDISRNVCHGSDSIDSAKREINLWFEM